MPFLINGRSFARQAADTSPARHQATGSSPADVPLAPSALLPEGGRGRRRWEKTPQKKKTTTKNTSSPGASTGSCRDAPANRASSPARSAAIRNRLFPTDPSERYPVLRDGRGNGTASGLRRSTALRGTSAINLRSRCVCVPVVSQHQVSVGRDHDRPNVGAFAVPTAIESGRDDVSQLLSNRSKRSPLPSPTSSVATSIAHIRPDGR